MTDTFPGMVDSTMRADFVACPERFHRKYVQGLSTTEENTHLVAGGAFAKGLEVVRTEVYGNRTPFKNALGKGLKALVRAYGPHEPHTLNPKTCEAMMLALADYFVQYPVETDVLTPLMVPSNERPEPAIEISFLLPIPGTTHPDTGGPVMYAGRFDMLATMKPGASVFIVDEKTTTQLGSQWSKKWALRGQFTGYAWAMNALGHNVAGVVVRGISILSGGFGHAQAITYRPEWMRTRWLEQMRYDINRMVACYKAGRYDQAFDEACSQYGGCSFLPLCESPEPENWLNTYVVRRWNPVTGETT